MAIVDALVDGVDLSTTVELTQEQVETMWGDEKTRLPPTIVRPVSDRWLTENMSAEVRENRINRWFASWRQTVDAVRRNLEKAERGG